jgi:hypothetical protein
MTAAPPSNLFAFTDRVRALANAPSFASFVEPIKSQRGVTDSCIDTICDCFLSSRKGDVDSAAQRFVAFTRVVAGHNLSLALDSDIAAGLALSFILFYAPSGKMNTDPSGRPVIHMLPRNIDFSKVSVHQMKKTWFFVIMQIAFSCPAARLHGVVVINNAKDASRSAFNMDFQGTVPRPLLLSNPISEPHFFTAFPRLRRQGHIRRHAYQSFLNLHREPTAHVRLYVGNRIPLSVL